MDKIRFHELFRVILPALLGFMLFGIQGFSQIVNKNPIGISEHDSVLLCRLPILKTPPFLKGKDLPYSLDNSIQPYMRPYFEQVSLECGQFSGIALNFNYEINYRRGLSSNIPENQYPTHFTFNFMNGGYGWSGVSYIHSFEIVKANGQPNVVDYGGTSNGGENRWLSGYEKYYHGMFNRIEEVYQILANTPEGLNTLKNWMANHLEGAEVGGIASFYSSNPWNTTTLPAGTPEAGKHVMVEFASPGHASTIVGWNDSIRYDYNSDGSYTNDIDINDDGVVDMKDWEIGGLLFTESYNGGLSWADSGYCYMMYKTLADNVYDGGIWNHAVHVLDVMEDYEPLATYKIVLKHNSRDKVKVIVGVSADINSLAPEYTMSFPLFNFQGGNQFMQGGIWNNQNKTIEFGLDITPLLGMINNGEPSKFFLLVEEDDPGNVGGGEIVGFSLMDYTSGLNETQCPQAHIPILDNSLTIASLLSTIGFDQLQIITNSFSAVIDEPYSQQIETSGGNGSFNWNIVKHYSQNSSSASLPQIDEVQLEPSNNENGIALKKIDFEFPFYGKGYDSVFVHVDGFLMFDEQVYPWPYMYDPQLMVRKTKIIAPYLNVYLNLIPENNDGIWYEGDEGFAAFKWKATIDGENPVEDVVFAVILFPSGNIEYYYGSDNLFSDYVWTVGISDGDDVNYSFMDKNMIAAGTKVLLEPSLFPEEMALSEDGLFYGTPLKKYTDVPIEFMVEDYNNVRVRKTMKFYSWYAGVENEGVGDGGIDCFPNPFSDQINIGFTLRERSKVSIEIINSTGQQIANIENGFLSNGKQSIQWDAINDRGEAVPKGVYFVLLKIGDDSYTRKIVLL